MDKAKHKPAILQVLPAMNTGGVERGVSDLAIYGKNNGYRIIVASSGGRMVEKLDKNGIEHICLNLRTKNPFKIITNSFCLRSICKKEHVKIIHARSRAPAWSAYLAAKMLRIPFITTFHGFYKNNFPLKRYYNAIMTKGDKVIAVSEFVRAHIFDNYNVDPKKVMVIHRGIDIHEFNPTKVHAEEVEKFRQEHFLPSSVPVILLPGRITRWKGQDVAIRAIAELGDRDVVLAIAGGAEEGNNYLKELIALIDKLRLEKKVKFLSDIKNMKLAYAACDLVLSTSVEPETFGRVSAEAGAMEKIVIATNHGGSKEIVIDGETGCLVEKNSAKQLAAKIDLVLNQYDSRTRNQMGHNARIRVINNFSLHKMCDTTLDLYNNYFKFRS